MPTPYRSREEVRQLLKALHDSGELEAMIQEATAATSEVTHGTMSDGAKRRLVPSSVVPSEELDQFEVIALHQEMCHQSARPGASATFQDRFEDRLPFLTSDLA